MTLDSAYEICMAILPSITAILSSVGVALGLLSKFKTLRKQIDDKTDLQEYKEQVKQISEEDKQIIADLIAENQKLEKEISELVDKIDKIKRG